MEEAAAMSTHDLTPERWAEIERLYEEIMRGYVPAYEAYDAALRVLYPPPVIITSDRTWPLPEQRR
jgi:hypothetical protein